MKNHVKKFGSFVNEHFHYPSTKKLRSQLVGGKGQKAQYDELGGGDQVELESQFAELSGDPELAKAFVRKLSKYNSIEDIKAGLEQMLDVLRNPRTEDNEPDWDMRNY
jgi:hypothetical protein